LPISEASSAEDVIDFINAQPSPLGLNLFSGNQSLSKQTLNSTASGDAALSECMLQPTIHDLPFGGVGNPGVGKYHGESGFRASLNARGVLSQSTRVDFGGALPALRPQSDPAGNCDAIVTHQL
jgi:aldehyde dehydrogenase (NAD+)